MGHARCAGATPSSMDKLAFAQEITKAMALLAQNHLICSHNLLLHCLGPSLLEVLWRSAIMYDKILMCYL